MGIGILTDSTADLPDNLYKKYDIEVIPLTVTFGNDTFVDGQEINSEEFFQKINQYNEQPTTSMPSVGNFIEKYKKLNEKYDQIISIHLSENLSGTLNSARLAAKEFSEIEIFPVDSKSISLGLGFQVLYAARLIEAGKNIPEIKEKLAQARKNLLLYFTVNDLAYMKEGGRIGKAQAFLGSILNINPIISISTETGEVEPLDKTRGKTRTFRKMIEIAEERLSKTETAWIGFAHGNRKNDMLKFKNKLLDKINTNYNINPEIFETRISPTLGSHVGPSVYAGFIMTDIDI
ncbi:MAG: DegV family protein [Halanaerobiaceae bacterium]